MYRTYVYVFNDTFSLSGIIASNGEANNKAKWTQKEGLVAYVEAIACHLHRGTEKNNEIC